MNISAHSNISSQQAVLSEAISKLQEKWELTNKDIAEVIGKDTSFITRLHQGKTHINPDDKTGQLSLLLIRIFRSLGAFLGDRMHVQQEWLKAHNYAFNNSPLNAMKTIEGINQVVMYLDHMRGADG